MWPFKKKEHPKKKIVQVVAGGRVIGSFVALKNFTCPDTESVYVKGMVYNIREGNQHLNDVLQTWSGAGKVRIG